VSVTNVPFAMVPGNHDPDLKTSSRSLSDDAPWMSESHDNGSVVPSWCTSVDGRVLPVGELLVAGLGGSMRYRPGPNQYTEREMRRRVIFLETRTRIRHARRRVDVLLTHAPPRGLGDADDLCHRGFACFHPLVRRLAPRYLVHGHIHPYGQPAPDRRLGDTVVVNAVGHRLLELPGDDLGRR
jgi:Icc-related predicted phosphoesterase